MDTFLIEICIEIIIDLHAAIRNNTDRTHAHLTQFPPSHQILKPAKPPTQ